VENLSDQATVDHLPDGHEITIPATVVKDGGHFADPSGGFDDLGGFGDGDGEGLFGHHMPPGLKTLDRDGCVRVVRRDDNAQLRVAAGK